MPAVRFHERFVMEENELELEQWKHYVYLDDAGYVMLASFEPESELSELMRAELDDPSIYDFTGERLHAYRWDEERQELIFDEDKYTELLAEQARGAAEIQIIEMQQALRQTDNIILEALEKLFSATTLTGFLQVLLSAGREIRETLTARNEIREEIEKLRKR